MEDSTRGANLLSGLMKLAAGTRLGAYDIQGALGAGGTVSYTHLTLPTIYSV